MRQVKAMRWTVLGAIGLCCAAGAPAGAQRVAGDDPPIASGGLTTVAPVNGRGWRIDATLHTLYDDNILRIGDGVAVPPGRDKADFRISPAIEGAEHDATAFRAEIAGDVIAGETGHHAGDRRGAGAA